jgi:tetratricopeptide (TPR) repeat protein
MAVGAMFVCLGGASLHAQAAQPTADRNQATISEAKNPDLEQARILVSSGKFAEAEDLLRRSLAANPHSSDAHFLLGYALFQQIHQVAEGQTGDASFLKNRDHRAKQSLAEFTEGARSKTPGAFELKIVALDYVLLGDYDDADKWLTKSLQSQPSDAQAWYYLGRIKYSELRFQEAADAFYKCLRLDKQNIDAEANLGLAYQGLGRPDDAMTAFKNAISWQSNLLIKSPQPFMNAGTLLLEQNRAADAIPYLIQAVQIIPEEFRVHEQLAKAYLQTNELEKAELELEKSVSLSPETVSAHFLLGRTYSRRGLTKQAQIEFEKCAALGKKASTEQPNP